MSAQAVTVLLSRLTGEEGEKLLPYDDVTGLPVKAPKGQLSWGRGFNLMACGSVGLFDVMERYLLSVLDAQLTRYAWYTDLNPVRQSVVLDIAYNEGVHGLLDFPHMIVALTRRDWPTAAKECSVFQTNPKLDASRYAPLRALILSG